MRVLLDDEHGAARLAQRGDVLHDALDDHGREAERRFIQQQQPWPRHRRTRERHHLLLAAGQCARKLAAALAKDREALKLFVERVSGRH